MRIPILFSAVTAVAVLAACSAVPLDDTTVTSDIPGYLAVADEAVTEGGTLDLYTTVDNGAATGLDPQLADVATAWQLMSLVYEPLVTVGPDFSIEPLLAESWETPSPTEYVFHLREGVTFSNGRPMTADDVAGSLNRLLEGEGVWKAQIGPVEQVSTIDEHTVSVRLSKPYAPLLAALANVPASVLPMKEIEDGSLDPARTMLGTGPYVVESHRQDVSWRFQRWDGYWAEGKPVADTVNIVIAGQEQARMAALQNGSADLVMLGNVDAPRLLAGARGTSVGTQATTDFYYLMLNSNASGGKFDDPRVRQAINIALDRQAMAESALGGLGEPTAVTPAGLPGACDPARLPSAEADLEKAKDLLREAGAENLSFGLAVYSTAPAPSVAQVIEQNLRRIGITVTIEQLDEGSWAGKVYGEVPATFDAALSWFAGYADASMVGKWWNPEQAGFNAGFMEPNPELGAAIDKAIETEGEGRESALLGLCEAVDADAQMIPLVTKPALIGYRSDALSPTLYATEGYGNAFRGVADFRLLSK